MYAIPLPPQYRHWDNLREFRKTRPRQPTVELDDFLKYWQVSNAELAEICECSVKTVERWFFAPTSPNRRNPTEYHKQRLAEAHYLWYLNQEQEQHKLNKLTEIYNRRSERANK